MNRNRNRRVRKNQKKKRLTNGQLDSYLLFWVCIKYRIISLFLLGFDVLKTSLFQLEWKCSFGFGVDILLYLLSLYSWLNIKWRTSQQKKSVEFQKDEKFKKKTPENIESQKIQQANQFLLHLLDFLNPSAKDKFFQPQCSNLFAKGKMILTRNRGWNAMYLQISRKTCTMIWQMHVGLLCVIATWFVLPLSMVKNSWRSEFIYSKEQDYEFMRR